MNNRNDINSHQSEQNQTFISKYKKAVLDKIKSCEENLKEPCSPDELKVITKIKDKINNHDLTFLMDASKDSINIKNKPNRVSKEALLQELNYLFSSIELFFISGSIIQGKVELYLFTIALCYVLDRYEHFVLSCYDNNESVDKCKEVLSHKFFENDLFNIIKSEFNSLKNINLENIFNFSDRIANNIGNVAYSNYRFFRDMAADFVSQNKKTTSTPSNTTLNLSK